MNHRSPFVLAIWGALLPLNAATGQDTYRQTDWSGGPGEVGPVREWDNRFESATNVAWRSIAGQLSLAGDLRSTPVRTVITEDGAGQPRDVAAGDLDGDGRTDLVTTDPVYDIYEDLGAIYWWKLLPDGQWQRRDVSLDYYGANYVDTVDLDQDGDLDIIATKYYDSDRGDGGYAWFENLNGDASQWRQHTVGTYYWGASHIDVGDFDGDGDLDLVGASQLTDGVPALDWDITWFENLDGQGHDWRPHLIDEDFDGATEVHTVDFDNDGDWDILGTYSYSFGRSQFAWYENLNGDGSAFGKNWIPFEFWGPGIADVGDIDDDGDMDFVGVGFNDSAFNLWRNVDGQGDTWNVQPIAGIAGVYMIELCDLEGDGDLDILLTHSNGVYDDSAYIFEHLDGYGTEWDSVTLEYVNLYDPQICAADVNNDGRLDAVITSISTYPEYYDEIGSYDIGTFGVEGQLTSQVVFVEHLDYRTISWDADVPEGTTLKVEVRASDDPENMGGYVEVSYPGQRLLELINFQHPYFQYRLTLTSDSINASPVVRSVAINDLYLTPFVPGIAGRVNRIEAFWDFGSRIYFVYSLRPGRTGVPGCPGVTLELGTGASIFGSPRVGLDGTATLNVGIPAAARGKEVFLQTVAPGCRISNRVRQRFE